MQDFVVFDHVCKTYRMGDVRIDALKDASFAIAEGEICVIVGQSGAGKTTLIKKLLKEALSGEKVVLIENEFGEIGIDGGFMKEAGTRSALCSSSIICFPI